MTKESFDTKLEQLVPDGESFNSTANGNNLSSENNPNFVTLTLDMFESDDNTEHIVPDAESFNSTANGNNLSSENKPEFVTLTLDMFESDDNTEHIKEEVKKPIPKYIIDRTNRIRAAYRKAANLDEDCEITENMISTFKLEQMCAENGWTFEIARKSLLRKDI